MNKFWKLAPWLSRLFLLPPVALFLWLGVTHLMDPAGSLVGRGIVFQSGFGLTTGRIAFGAMPLACALFLAGCLFPRRRLLTGLSFLLVLDGVILIARSFAVMADASLQDNLRIIYAETGIAITTAAGILLELRRRQVSGNAGRAPELDAPSLQHQRQPTVRAGQR